MGRHSDTREGRADDWSGCSGENRADPDSWSDPDIDETAVAPPVIEAAELDENGEVPPCS